ncbi:MAG: TonB-dependent receptor [Gammaproteobacteria bacterium]
MTRPARALLGVCFLAATAIQAAADENGLQKTERIIVTATRIPTPSGRIGSSVSVITAAEIEAYQYRNIGDALQSIPSLSVVRNGGAGKLTSIFSRGTNANHTLVLIDGIEINDPANPDGRIDLSNIYIGDVERIEVLEGPQGTLYGSDAIGGVIQIFTKKGRGAPAASGMIEGGSFDTLNEQLSAGGGTPRGSWTLNLQHNDTDGHSALSGDFRQPNGVLDDDGHEALTLSSRLVYSPADLIEFDFSGRYIESDNDLDLNVFPVRDDSDSDSDADQLYLGLNTRLGLFDGRTDHRLGISYTDIDRHDRDDFDPVNSNDFLRDHNTAKKLKFELQNDIFLSEAHTFTVGLETEEDSIDSSLISESLFGTFTSSADETVRNNAVYLQDQFILGERLSGTLGVRVDDHEAFDNETTWRLAGAYQLPATGMRLKGSYATGFKAPTLVQLYGISATSFGPFTGNPDLKPETSEGWELGFEQTLASPDTRFGATYYRNDIEDLITFSDDFSTNINRNEVKTWGIEAFLDTRLSARLSAGVDYNHTLATDEATGEALRRRPLNKAVTHLDYTARRELTLTAEGIFIGKRYDTDPVTAARIRRGGYFIANLAASWTLSHQWELFGRIDNLFDRDYEEPAGFEQPGTGIYAGVRVRTR